MPNSAFEQAVAVCLSSIRDEQNGVLSNTNAQWRPMNKVTGYQRPSRGSVQQPPQGTLEVPHKTQPRSELLPNMKQNLEVFRFGFVTWPPAVSEATPRHFSMPQDTDYFFQCLPEVTNSDCFGPRYVAVPWISHKKDVLAIHLLHKGILRNCSQHLMEDRWEILTFPGNFYPD